MVLFRPWNCLVSIRRRRTPALQLLLLKDPALSKWTLVRNALAPNLRTTVARFRTAVNNYITEHFYPAGTRNIHLQSLRNARR